MRYGPEGTASGMELRLPHRKKRKKKQRGPRLKSRPSLLILAQSSLPLLLVSLSCLTLRNLDSLFTFPLTTLLNSDCSFRSLSFALSVLSRVAPKRSLSTRPQS